MKFWLVGRIVKLQDGVAGSCVTVNVWPATVIDPERELVAMLAATE